MIGRKWINLNSEKNRRNKKYLIQAGGIEETVYSASEIYRIKILNGKITCYKNGTLYTTCSDSKIQ